MVVKIGSQVITKDNNGLNEAFMSDIARQIKENNDRWNHIIVSSGAVAAGIPSVRNYDPSDITLKQKAAAFGQPRLMRGWKDAFRPFDMPVAQLLITKKNIANQMRIVRSIDEGIAVLNGDDTAYTPKEEENIIFEDNDGVAARATIILPADVLLYITKARGLIDKDGNIIKEIHPGDDLREKVIYERKSDKGTGGMQPKNGYCLYVAERGKHSYIVSGDVEDVIHKVARGENPGTHYIAKK